MNAFCIIATCNAVPKFRFLIKKGLSKKIPMSAVPMISVDDGSLYLRLIHENVWKKN